jgi:hypothetical protein
MLSYSHEVAHQLSTLLDVGEQPVVSELTRIGVAATSR